MDHERQHAHSTVTATFTWSIDDDYLDMPLTDACLTLEHLVDWK